MSDIPKGIAEANTYAAAFKALILQLMLIAILIGLLSGSWWWSLSVFFVLIAAGLYKWVGVFLIALLSLFWGALFFKISLEAGGGYLVAFPLAAIAAFIACGINMSGMIGFGHATPDFTQ